MIAVTGSRRGAGAVGMRHRRGRRLLAWLAPLTLLVAVLGLAHGAVPIPLGEVLRILASPLGLAAPADAQAGAVLLGIRLPRLLLGLASGAAIATAGAALQGLFRNPLADPGLIGVSPGAALAAVATIVLAERFAPQMAVLLGPLLLPVAAFGGGLLATFIVLSLASRDGHVEVTTMLLAGIAVNAVTMAGVGGLVFISDEQQMREITFWTLGSLAGVTWGTLLPSLPFLLLPLAALPLLARALNGLLLGEADAYHLGFAVERAKRLVILLAALGTGAAVALTGIIGFVGLIAPHLARLIFGPDHRVLLPASAALGAMLMVLADLFARTVVLPAELPVGVLTSAIGGPCFVWLLARRRRFG
jgi:iron complex transport system permease protein